MALLIACPASSLIARAQGGISTEGPFTVLRTDTTNSLLTFAVPLSVPGTNEQPVLHFDFGFSTSEPEAAQTFYDSFSVTLQTADQSASALLLTADRTGSVLTPAMPGGLELSPTNLTTTATHFPALAPEHLLKLAFSIAFAIPAALADAPVTLLFDLFDNLNAFASLAWVANVRLDALATPPYRLLSAPVPGGPYAEEPGAQLDLDARLFTVASTGAARFYRVSGDRDSVITRLEAADGQVLVNYAVVNVRLLSAASADGPYSEVAPVSVDEAAHTMVAGTPSSPRFYRLESNARTRITGIRATPAGVLLTYALVP